MTNKFIVGEKWQNIGLKYDGHGREFGIKEWDLRKKYNAGHDGLPKLKYSDRCTCVKTGTRAV